MRLRRRQRGAWNIKLLLDPVVLPSPLQWISNTPTYTPIIPGVAGWGWENFAGVTKSVVIVDRLTTGVSDGALVSAASGFQPALYRGSLRWAVERTFPRDILFETSGWYDMQRTQLIDNPFCTIAFQTAPSPGFFLKNGNFQGRANDILIMHMQVYNGDETSAQDILVRRGYTFGSGLAVKPERNVLAWCSLYWGSDGNVAATQGGTDFTMSHCLIAEGLANPAHPEYPHSQSVVLDSEVNRVCMQRCLKIHAKARNPLCRILNHVEVNCISYNTKGHSGLTNAGSFGLDLQGKDLSEPQVNLVANFYIKGPDFSDQYGGALPINARGPDDLSFGMGPGARLYMSFNKAHGWDDSTQQGLVNQVSGLAQSFFASARLDASWPDGLRGLDPGLAGYLDLAESCIGARPKDRSAGRDALMWQHLKNRLAGTQPQGTIPETTADVGGYFNVPVNTWSLFDNTDMEGDPIPFENYNEIQSSGRTAGQEWQYRRHLKVAPAV